MARHKDGDWKLSLTNSGSTKTWDEVQTAVLMDLRDELKELNRKFVCGSAIEQRLRGIEREVRRLRVKPRITVSQAARVLARKRNRKKP